MKIMASIAPSILAADFRILGDQIAQAEAGGGNRIHVDVMDGHFVPNLSIGLPVVVACRAATALPVEVHLMISAPERYLTAFAEAGGSLLIVHAEATPHAHRAVQVVRDLGLRAGLALNPGTPLDHFRPLLPDLDLALVMSVNPGFGGQRFIPRTLERLALLREWRDALNPDCEIEVDGGVNLETVRACVSAGADVLVAGSAVYNTTGTVGDNIADLQRALTDSGTTR